ncbi:hypothetical protein DPMN_038792 [Dreissena polymorpha]|uniref:Uncharacterized protein n=1 Tax=Dreissena polymorpha TaxID=45954 RepID=A0A9D4MG62_DREPO|nr:hypothetical protein DPMN_038792 [Dreissena polymorpha]
MQSPFFSFRSSGKKLEQNIELTVLVGGCNRDPGPEVEVLEVFPVRVSHRRGSQHPHLVWCVGLQTLHQITP